MQFRDELESLIKCKVSGMCARDGLVTEELKKKSERFYQFFQAKVADYNLLVEILKALHE